MATIEQFELTFLLEAEAEQLSLGCVNDVVVLKIVNWLRAHPVSIGPALTLAVVFAALYLLIDPVTVLLFAVLALAGGFAAFIDPKTYSRKVERPLDD
jgi:hypothetical protein